MRYKFERRYRTVDFKKDDWMLQVLKVCKERLDKNPDDEQSKLDVGLIKILHEFNIAIDKSMKGKSATTKS